MWTVKQHIAMRSLISRTMSRSNNYFVFVTVRLKLWYKQKTRKQVDMTWLKIQQITFNTDQKASFNNHCALNLWVCHFLALLFTSVYKVPVKSKRSPDSLSCFIPFVMQSVVHVHVSKTVPSLCFRHKLNRKLSTVISQLTVVQGSKNNRTKPWEKALWTQGKVTTTRVVADEDPSEFHFWNIA